MKNNNSINIDEIMALLGAKDVEIYQLKKLIEDQNKELTEIKQKLEKLGVTKESEALTATPQKC